MPNKLPIVAGNGCGRRLRRLLDVPLSGLNLLEHLHHRGHKLQAVASLIIPPRLASVSVRGGPRGGPSLWTFDRLYVQSSVTTTVTRLASPDNGQSDGNHGLFNGLFPQWPHYKQQNIVLYLDPFVHCERKPHGRMLESSEPPAEGQPRGSGSNDLTRVNAMLAAPKQMPVRRYNFLFRRMCRNIVLVLALSAAVAGRPHGPETLQFMAAGNNINIINLLQEELLPAFEREFGVRVEFSAVSWAERTDRLALLVASGLTPDVIGTAYYSPHEEGAQGFSLPLGPTWRSGSTRTAFRRPYG